RDLIVRDTICKEVVNVETTAPRVQCQILGVVLVDSVRVVAKANGEQCGVGRHTIEKIPRQMQEGPYTRPRNAQRARLLAREATNLTEEPRDGSECDRRVDEDPVRRKFSA